MRLILLAVVLAGLSPAQSPTQEDVLRTLLSRIDALERRVNELEGTQAHAEHATPPNAPMAVEEPLTATSEHEGHGNALLGSVGSGISLRGFADLGFTSERQDTYRHSFGLGQLDLFLTSRISRKVDFLAEAVFEYSKDNSSGIDLERILLQYKHNEYFNIDVGRYHGSIGYYNSAYHHGSWLQTTAGRPGMFQFEDDGGLLPIHNVGIALNGRLPGASAGLRYAVEVGNGRNYRTGEEPVQTVMDNNLAKAFNVALSASPRVLPGLRIGGSFYKDTLNLVGGPTNQHIAAGYAVYDRAGTEFLNEFVLMQHTQNRTQTTIPAFYNQISHRYGSLRPFVRYEWTNRPVRDPVVRSLGAAGGWSQETIAGVRYDFSEFAALKFQGGRRSGSTSTPAATGAVQLSFTF